ncbi:GNAT family N-acetyltransferase [Spirochaeta cellobiosiphila]|uniref:GNAT family N-acetyltransferase n=1 Tax=Spirochaeta cellobiosiphila TaxID=504483 RepID=UPI0003F70B40|nr:GNAT family N-acetyltransferase [Spirochaeta cellobiosiphila]
MSINAITSESAIEQYKRMAKYCFVDTTGWTDTCYPLPKDKDIGFGLFDGETLTSAVINRRYNVHLYGVEKKLCGISGVISLPEVRQQGGIRQIMTHLLKEAVQNGDQLSALYPFKYGFYEKFGYGYLGGLRQIIFSPSSLVRQDFKGSSGYYHNTKQEWEDIKTVIRRWSTFYNFAAHWDDLSKDSYERQLKESNHYAYLIYNSRREPCAYLQFALLDRGAKGGSSLKLHKASWTGQDGWSGLVDFLGRHRDQCESIEWIDSGYSPIIHELKEPRADWKQFGSWMARPLDVRDILESYIQYYQFKGNLSFSLQDPVLKQNTGTYIISKGTLDFKPEELKAYEMTLSRFSSLLFGSITSSHIPYLSDTKDMPNDVSSLFDVKHDPYFVSEYF